MSPTDQQICQLALSGDTNSICTFIDKQYALSRLLSHTRSNQQRIQLNVMSSSCIKVDGTDITGFSNVYEALREFVDDGARRGARIVCCFLEHTPLPFRLDAYIINAIKSRGSLNDPVVFQIIAPLCSNVVSPRLNSLCIRAHLKPVAAINQETTRLSQPDLPRSGLASYKHLSQTLQRQIRKNGYSIPQIAFSLLELFSDSDKCNLVHEFARIQHTSLYVPLSTRVAWVCDGIVLAIRSLKPITLNKKILELTHDEERK